MGFGPVGTIRKQVMRQTKAKKKAENNIFNASLPNIKIPKSYSIKVPKSTIKFWYWEVRVICAKKGMDDIFNSEDNDSKCDKLIIKLLKL